MTRESHEAPPARAVVFDLYGTLVDEAPREAWQEMQDALADALALDRERFAGRWHESYEARVTGPWEPSARALVTALDGEWSEERFAAAVALRRRFIDAALAPRPDAEAVLSELSTRGLRLGLVTECSEEVPLVWPTLALARWFDACVYTAVAGVRKPHPSLYETICEQLGVPAAACVYVGDGGGYELAGAAKAGMRPVLISVPYAPWLHPEAESWDGERVSSLSELLDLV
jgi:putative hydrolase of the HAD superfamily